MPEPLLSFTRNHRPGKPTVVFLHGFLGNKEDWTPVIDALGDQFDTIAIDLPGHSPGHPSATDLFDFAECGRAIFDLLTECQVHRYCLIGYSMGGRIALHEAVRHTAQIQRLVLISANPGLKSETERISRLARDEQLANELEGEGLERFIDRWYEQTMFDPLRTHLNFGQIRARRLTGDAAQLAQSLRRFSVGRQRSLWPDLPGLNIPVLVVAGELDPKYVGLAQQTADLCRQGKLCIISHAGHAAHLERALELARALRPFITAHT